MRTQVLRVRLDVLEDLGQKILEVQCLTSVGATLIPERVLVYLLASDL